MVDAANGMLDPVNSRIGQWGAAPGPLWPGAGPRARNGGHAPFDATPPPESGRKVGAPARSRVQRCPPSRGADQASSSAISDPIPTARRAAARPHSAPITLPVPLYAPVAHTPGRASVKIGNPVSV